ncbi:glutathione S-transferase family protein [Pseudoruegeria sp. HB172150]|uniref:glutathione S-transferase family protein n=1 Tax=Pseudoruegeria sp. HB172150 TaxID=2721164 RepID=UPI001554652A|nr:glutathione S-transferase family protein [Pseudoruegeria sp. HB172150]
MIILYGHGTPNVLKIAIALEELELPYRAETVNFLEGGTQTPDFLSISPAGKIPAIRDGDLTVCESNVILTYLADKTGKLAPTDPADRLRMQERLFIQGSLQGPMFGQRAFYTRFSPDTVPLAIDRYEEQGKLIDMTAERLLGDRDYMLGDDFSIVDISWFGWYYAAWRMGYIEHAPNTVAAWYDRIAARPGVQRGLSVYPTAPLPADKRAA